MDRNPAAPFDGKSFGTEMVEVVKTYFERQFSPFLARLEAIEQQIKALPVPENGRDADPVVVADIAVQKLMPEISDLRSTIAVLDMAIKGLPDLAETVAAVVAEIPVPKDGTPGKSVSVEDVIPVITKAVADQVSQIPIPKDGLNGTSVTIEDVLPVIKSEIAAAVAALPPAEPGQDGKSVTPEEVLPVIAELVASEVNKLPVPQDGKSVDPLEVRTMVEETVAKAVAEIPPAPAGKDGISVSLTDVEPVVLAEVKRLVAEFPAPENGKSVTPEELAPLVVAEVEKAVSKIPVPKDGLGIAGSFIDRDGNLIVTMTDGTAKELGPVVGRDGRDAEVPDLSEIEDLKALPDELNERIAKAVRLMAETPVLEVAAAAYQTQIAAPAAVKTQPDIHVHMPEIKEMKVSMDAVIPAQEIVVKNELPPPRKTRTVVEEHDARGRVKKFRQEEID